MKEVIKYHSYNQITKEFDVYIMQTVENNFQFKLVKKSGNFVKKDTKPRESKPPKWFTTYMETFRKEFKDEIMKEFDQKLKDSFDKFAKINNLKTI